MSHPAHTPGPVEVVIESDRHVDGLPFKDYFIFTSGDKSKTIADTYNSDSAFTEEDRHANARLLAAAYNAFDSAAKKLRLNAVKFAEQMQDGGISELVETLTLARDWINDEYERRGMEDEEYASPASAMATLLDTAIAKVKGGAA